jgi:hypothetical protein
MPLACREYIEACTVLVRQTKLYRHAMAIREEGKRGSE